MEMIKTYVHVFKEYDEGKWYVVMELERQNECASEMDRWEWDHEPTKSEMSYMMAYIKGLLDQMCNDMIRDLERETIGGEA